MAPYGGIDDRQHMRHCACQRVRRKWHRTSDTPMSTMNSEVYAALIDAGAVEDKAREAAKSVARYDIDIAEIKASLLLLKWMSGFVLTFVVATTWRVFA